MDLNEIRVFVKVAQVGSFSHAGRQLGMPNSTVSARVSGLERRLGVMLMQRTTRKLRLTEAGEAYFRQCLQGLEQIQKAELQVTSSQREAQGTLRVTAPTDMGSNGLVALTSRFTKLHPKVSLEFLFTDRVVDLVAEGVDLAIRAGELGESGLIARKLGMAYWAPFASPAYLKRAGQPAHPKDLRAHSCLLFTPLGEDSWSLTSGKSVVTVPIARKIMGNDVNLLRGLALAGHGIALLPTFSCQGDTAGGRLVRVLPEWRSNADPVHLVYPEQRFLAPKTRAFIDVAVEVFKKVFEQA